MSTLAIRNCNPLNIRHTATRWQGEISPDGGKGFCRFIDMPSGFRAAFILMFSYMQRHSIHTIEGIVSRWAPPTENNTTAYIEHVCRATGIGGKEVLSVLDRRIPDIVWAMAQIEAGREILRYRSALDHGYELARQHHYYTTSLRNRNHVTRQTPPTITGGREGS